MEVRINGKWPRRGTSLDGHCCGCKAGLVFWCCLSRLRTGAWTDFSSIRVVVVWIVLMLYSRSRGCMDVYIPVVDLRCFYFDCHFQLLEQCI